MPVSRRNLLTGLAATAALAGLGPDRAFAAALAEAAPRVPVTQLWLRRDSTGEEVSAIVRAGADYARADLLLLSWLLRDVSDESAAVWIDPALFDLLASVQAALSAVHGAVLPLVVTSGYRTRRHNDRLEGAARSSLHLRGQASDLKVPGYDAGAVALAGALFRRGGVGIYPGFCHLDIGHTRVWTGGVKPAPPAGLVPGTPLPSPPPASPAPPSPLQEPT